MNHPYQNLARPQWVARSIVLAGLAALLLAGCCKEERKKGSTSTEADDSVDTRDQKQDPPTDLESPLELGMQITDARPPLTADCQAHHYAERLSRRHLRLRCMTSPVEADTDRQRHFIEIGFLEYDDAPPRLAYYVEEWHVPRHAAPFTWLRLLASGALRLGQPGVALRPGRAAWQGKGRGGGNTTAELRQSSEGEHAVVSMAFRHTDFSEQLH